MLGITYHNPATISVFLDRMRFRDCFISTEELKDETWKTKLKPFVDLPSDGRDRVLFVESFAALQSLLNSGADLKSVKVAVYDACEVLSKVPGVNIVDAHVNGDAETWQLYTVSFSEFNDALAEQPSGVPGLLREHEVKDDIDLPEEPKPTRKPEAKVVDDDDEADEPAAKDTGSQLVMEQLLDDIEAADDDVEDELPPLPTSIPEKTPDRAVTVMPEPARVVIPKGQVVEVTPEKALEIVEPDVPEEPMPPEPEVQKPLDTVRFTDEESPPVEPKPKSKPKPKPKAKAKKKKPALKVHELF